MIRISGKRGFTLVELLVVVGMIAVILGAISSSVSGAFEKARIQKATTEVKVVAQAVLAFENFAKNENLSIPEISEPQEANADTLGFLLGTKYGEKVPALLMASLQSGKAMRDPWGKPYRISINKKQSTINFKVASQSMLMRYSLPNYHRLAESERQ